MLRALLTENHRRVIIINNNNDSSLQLATLLKYGTNDRQREPLDMKLHMSVRSMMVCILSKDSQRS
jgi:hypothetical protein